MSCYAPISRHLAFRWSSKQLTCQDSQIMRLRIISPLCWSFVGSALRFRSQQSATVPCDRAIVVGSGKVVITRVAKAAVALLSPLALVMPAAGAGDAGPTFTKQVAPILYRHCVGCHRSGQIGAAQLLDSYAASKPLAAAIEEQVLKRLMPPWSADPAHSAKFSNDPRLSR